MVCTRPSALTNVDMVSVKVEIGRITSATSSRSGLLNALKAITVFDFANAARACSGLGRSASGSMFIKIIARRSPESTDSIPAPFALTRAAPTALPPTGKKPKVAPVLSAINCANTCKFDNAG